MSTEVAAAEQVGGPGAPHRQRRAHIDRAEIQCLGDVVAEPGVGAVAVVAAVPEQDHVEMRRVEGRQVKVQVELLRHQPCEMDRQVAEETGFGDGERDGLEVRHRRGDAALQAYAHRRDVAARPMYELTADLAQLVPPPPEMRALLAALASNPDETRRFLGVMAGTVAVADFFAPDNLARIVGAPPPQEAAAA